MPRKATGTIRVHGNHYDARITMPDGKRPWVHLKPGMSEAAAREKAAALSERVRARQYAPPPPAPPPVPDGETFATWAERWCKDREARGLTSVNDDRGRLRKWVAPAIGHVPLASVTKADVELLVESLDTKVRAAELSWKTATNVWGLVTKAFGDACASKVRALRVRDDNPTQGVRGPDRGAHKAKAYLYPSEFLALASCERVAAPWRRMYAVMAYLYVRAAEARALEWSDVDIDRGVVLVHHTVDADGRASTTKTGATRRFTIEPALMPLLRAMRNAAGGLGRVLPRMPVEKHLAPMLRRDLLAAGVTRADLHASDDARRKLRFHDLRATGITWMAVRGDDPLKIKQRAGHSTFSTTEGYIREAESVRDGFGDVFPPLPDALVSSAESSERWGANGHVYETVDDS